MAKAVLIHKPDSKYDDDPSVRYDFPKAYLSRIEKTVGDWIVYYEPRSANQNTGRLAYFATAQVDRIQAHADLKDRFFAFMKAGTFLGFDRPVARQVGGEIIERALRRDDGGLLNGGVANSAVRMIDNDGFAKIIQYAFTVDPGELGVEQSPETIDGYGHFGEAAQQPFRGPDADRTIISTLINRPFRDAAFARQVKAAYGNRCAISGLSLRNGGGRPEVEAAHIRPVKDGGPDSVRNGLALSHTLHWMFDRGLISIAEDHSILISHNKVPDDTVARLILPQRRLLEPADHRCRPHPEYLRYHREEIFGT
ncbi:MAG: HNH endonuclease [Pseudomonadota bacterium]